MGLAAPPPPPPLALMQGGTELPFPWHQQWFILCLSPGHPILRELSTKGMSTKGKGDRVVT